ncbi:MAG: hypothetical protein A2835_00115 [Candidatus Niyogibacteria bacterium RIFCSPHIGHO2_01_FULL_45_28]|uniref:Dihydrofolate reductase n=1 Tax=Candidatus Niyogibacteria bacterium RIFCSPLOWO2_02_FULL_45_13 TaxID=1801725 RepID=A0A1G2EXN4_9BACT|nr:MAG: hypothetical protein A2835_00115 [Candidatus Niyogibacteria bacterium RIFCSPHIGHO2_01_FULL_45_28]OGZ30565.1 MAG: hypothetical protein A3J00_03795 [Candidatus Niyogibacteria bacterium RIFCSPLOWO2_02_FULL_45_13]
MRISIIAAVAKNGVIGKNNSLPWNLPSDMKKFKELTIGKPVIMGRKTFESIGKPLAGRVNIILTRNSDFNAEGVAIVHSPEEALQLVADQDEIMIIGGESVYGQFLPRASRIYLTRVDSDFDGDSFFPPMDLDSWTEVIRETKEPDEKNAHRHTFFVYDKKTP